MRFLLLTLMFFLSGVSAGTGSVPVTLRAQSVVSGPYFRLADIADAGADGLSDLRIGRSPRAGGRLDLKPVDVERAIARLRPDLKGRIAVSGAEKAVIRRGPLQTLAVANVREAAARALEGFLAERSSRFEIEPLAQAQGNLEVPEGRIELRPRIVSAGAIPARISVWTDIYVDGAHYQSLPVAFAVRAYRQVLAATAALPAGKLLRPEDVSVREAQVAGYAWSPVPPESDVAGLRLKRSLAAGEVLTWRHAQQAPAVSRDQEIVVRLAVGAIALETAAVATQDARPGEVIRVRSSKSRETFSAQVTGAGAAEALWR